MACRIEKLVSGTVELMDESSSVQAAVRQMVEHNAGYVAVTRNGAVTGLFTERDLVTRVVGLGKDCAKTLLKDVCSTNLLSVSHDTTCQEAIRTMHRHACRRLLVFKRDELLGLLRLPDVANELASQSLSKNFVVNLLGGITFAVVLGVIVMLLMQLPNMMELANRVTN